MIVFVAIQMSAPKRKSPQSVIVELRIEGINAFELSFTFIYSKERVYELTECQKDINSGSEMRLFHISLSNIYLINRKSYFKDTIYHSFVHLTI